LASAAPSRRRVHIDPLALILPVGLLLLWWGAAKFGFIQNPLLPTIEDVGASAREWMFSSSNRYFFSGTWWRDLIGSVMRVSVGLIVGSALAIFVGTVVGWYSTVERVFDPTIQMLRPIPKTAFLPFAILIFGVGNPPALFLTIYGVFLTVYIQVVVGVKLVPRDLKRAARMLGARDRDVLLRVVLPAALPSIFAGIRVGAAYAWLILILAEMLAVGEGFGFVLWRGYENLRMDVVVMSMLCIGVFGYLTDRLIIAALRSKLSWAQDVADTRL
jgi:NitT/TauT family transport system permease protein